MPRVRPLFLFAILPWLVLTACEEKKTAAQLKAEQQKVWQAKSKARAAQYYRDIVTKYPESPFAAEAKQRLEAMGPLPATPKPAGK